MGTAEAEAISAAWSESAGHDIRPTVGQHGVVLGRALAPHDLQLDAQMIGIGLEEVVLIAVAFAAEHEIPRQRLIHDDGQPALLADARPELRLAAAAKRNELKKRTVACLIDTQ